MLFDVLFSVALLVYYVLLDALNLAVRPFLPIAFAWSLPGSPGFVLVASETLLFGAIASAVALVVVAAVTSLLPKRDLSMIPAMLLFPDGVASCVSFVLGKEAIYPAPRSFFTVFLVQLNMLPIVLGLANRMSKHVQARLLAAEFSLALAVTSRRLFDAELFAGPILCLIVSGGYLLYAVTPRALQRALTLVIQIVLRRVTATYDRLRRLAMRAWPNVREWILSVWRLVSHHPAAVWLQRYVLDPGWRVASPLVLPAINAVLAATLFRAVLAGSLREHPILLFAKFFCAASSAVCAVVLAMHAYRRVANVPFFDPLKNEVISRLLFEASRAVSAPFALLRWAFFRLADGHIFESLGVKLHELSEFGKHSPVTALGMTCFGSAAVLLLAYATSVGPFVTSAFGSYWTVFARLLRSFAMQFGAIRSGPLADSTSSVGAVVCIALSQTMIMFLVRRILDSQSPREAVALGLPMDPNERVMLAESMRDPRQCGRCAFGPVDYDGCAMLTSHHHERRGGAVVSNACPRCGWFVARLEQWPYFAPERQAARGAVVAVRSRAFAEVVIAIRAASKACVIPFVLLRVFSFSPMIGVVLVVAYLVPWASENSRTFNAMYGSDAHGGAVYPARNNNNNNRNRNNRNNNNNNDDCGRRAEPVQNVTVAEALEAIESAAPPKCFLPPDSSCSLCLDSFAPEAVAAAVRGAEALRALVPPVVALPCGHPLHLECAHQMCAVAQNARQLRCPLCREPISMGGSVSSRLFN